MIKSESAEDNSKIIAVLKNSPIPETVRESQDLLSKLKNIFSGCKKGKTSDYIRNNRADIEKLRTTYSDRTIEKQLNITRGLLVHALKSKISQKTLKPKNILATVQNVTENPLIYWKTRAETLELALTLICTGHKIEVPK